MWPLQSMAVVERFEHFTLANPRVVIIDPFDSLRQLLDRYKTYSTISANFVTEEVFVPPFVDLVSSDANENIRKLREAGVRYPFGRLFFIWTPFRNINFPFPLTVCKHVVAHGSRMAHQVCYIIWTLKYYVSTFTSSVVLWHDLDDAVKPLTSFLNVYLHL